MSYRALTGEAGKFGFEPNGALPPMFQAFPLQASLPSLAIEGIRRCEPTADAFACAALVFARQNPRGGCHDRAGLSPNELKIHALLDGSRTWPASPTKPARP